jgi:hypothetical protein
MTELQEGLLKLVKPKSDIMYNRFKNDFSNQEMSASDLSFYIINIVNTFTCSTLSARTTLNEMIYDNHWLADFEEYILPICLQNELRFVKAFKLRGNNRG